MVLLNPCNRLKFAPNMPLLPDLYYRSTVYDSFIGSVRSSSGDHGLIEIQQQQQGHFSKFSNLEQSCLYTFIIHFHFHSVFNVPNRTRQYFCMNYIDNACICVIFSKCSGLKNVKYEILLCHEQDIHLHLHLHLHAISLFSTRM